MQRIDRVLAVSAVANGRAWVIALGVVVFAIALVIVVAATRRMQ